MFFRGKLKIHTKGNLICCRLIEKSIYEPYMIVFVTSSKTRTVADDVNR